MHIYEQSTGKLWLADTLEGEGYSGAGVYKNDPLSQFIADQGPIPQGSYFIQEPIDTVTHGPYVLPLSPFSQNKMFGRTGFLMHGDSVIEPGTASKGCVIMPRKTREIVWASGDHQLQVVDTLPPAITPDIDGEITV